MAITVYNVYSSRLTFSHDDCTCSPIPNSEMPCRLNSTQPVVAVSACAHDLNLGGDINMPLKLVAPIVAGLYEFEWRMFPTIPAGLPQFWDVTVAVMVVAHPAMFSPEHTALTVSSPITATQPFDILVTVKDQ